MNINLISPTDNGHKYNVRFKEDIKIPKGSKVYMNYATLSRKGAFELESDQGLYLVIPQDSATNTFSRATANVYPTATTNDPAVNNIPFHDGTAVSNVARAVIQKGQYTYSQMLNQISTALNTMLRNVANGSNLKQYRALEEGDLDVDYDDGQNTEHDVAFGLVNNTFLSGNPAIDLTDFALAAGHSRNIAIDAASGAITKNNADKADENNANRLVFDNIGVSDSIFDFLNNYDSTPLKEMKFVQGIANQTFQEITAANGAVCIGLHNLLYANGIYGTDGVKGTRTDVDNRERTDGNGEFNTRGGVAYYNPEQSNYQNDNAGTVTSADSNKVLAMPFHVCIDGRGATAKVSVIRGTQTRPDMTGVAKRKQTLENAGAHITSNTVSSKTITNLQIDPTDTPNIGIYCYYTKEQSARQSSYYQEHPYVGYIGVAVVNMDKADFDASLTNQPDPKALIYRNDNVFNYHYFKDVRDTATVASTQVVLPYTGAQATTQLQSQYPFRVFVSTLKQNSGFESVQYTAHATEATEATRPLTKILKYSMLGDNDLAQQIGIQSNQDFARRRNRDNAVEEDALDQIYYPNGVSTDPAGAWGVKRTKFDLPWRRIGYSILIKNLPLQNYKNTDATRDGGFSKNILANIPAPFKNTNIEYNSKSRHLITATYEPPFKVNNNMNNQDFTVNNFDVEIVNNKNDKPATEVLNSVINFTIEPPDNKKDDNTILNLKTI